MNQDLLLAIPGHSAQIAAAFLFALILRHYAGRDGRIFLRFWVWSWAACSVFSAAALASRILSPSFPVTTPLRIGLSIVSLTAAYLQLIWLLLGSWELARRRAMERTEIVASVGAALSLAVVLTLAWIGAPDGGMMRYYARVGLRGGIAFLACAVAAVVFLQHSGGRRLLSLRLLPVALVLYGLDQLSSVYLAMPLAANLRGLGVVRLSFGYLDIFVQLILGLGIMFWLLEKEREERVQHLAERQRLEEQLRQSQKMDAIGRLAGGIAHDFNNMLMAISGYTSLALAAPDVSNRTRGYLNHIAGASERAAELTGKLLAFSRKRPVQARTIDLNEVTREAEALLRPMIGEHIMCDFDRADDRVNVHADPGQVLQIVLNLAVNARDAMPSGGCLTLTTDRMLIDERAARAHVDRRPGAFGRLRLSDTGSGIPQEHLPHIFEPFFTTKEVGKGTGLGLATAYGMARQHGGWIEVDTAVGVGTTFSVFLPIAEREPEVADADRAAAPKHGRETILLVEDDGAVRGLIAEVLREAGYEVIHADSAPAALARFDATTARVDLVVTDVVMPGGMNGIELVAALRRRQPALRVILMSGYLSDATAIDAERAGAFLEKPVSISELLTAVRQVLDQTPAG